MFSHFLHQKPDDVQMLGFNVFNQESPVGFNTTDTTVWHQSKMWWCNELFFFLRFLVHDVQLPEVSCHHSEAARFDIIMPDQKSEPKPGTCGPTLATHTEQNYWVDETCLFVRNSSCSVHCQSFCFSQDSNFYSDFSWRYITISLFFDWKPKVTFN